MCVTGLSDTQSQSQSQAASYSLATPGDNSWWEVSKDLTLHCVTLVHIIVTDFICLRCYSNVVLINL